MAFFDTSAYKRYLRRRISDSTTLVFALAFDPSGSFLAAGTTNGLLKIFSLSSIALYYYTAPLTPQECTVQDLSKHGSINGIEITCTHLYVATDSGLLCFDWKRLINPKHGNYSNGKTVPIVLLGGVQINAVITLGEQSKATSVLAATGEGAFVKVIDGGKKLEQIGENIGKVAYPHCVAGNTNPDVFLAGCNDRMIRHFDIRVSKPLKHVYSLEYKTPPQENAYISSLALHGDSNFVMIADSDKNLTSFHIPSASIVSSTKIPFCPQAIVFSDGYFYCGGSDITNTGLSHVDSCIQRCDVSFQTFETLASSTSSVYAMAVSSAGAIAAGGHSLLKSNDEELAERADVYLCPPVRSFSVFI
ncbi:unnamed protein product [Agarophyton chilense]